MLEPHLLFVWGLWFILAGGATLILSLTHGPLPAPRRWPARALWTVVWVSAFVIIARTAEPSWAAGSRLPNLFYPDQTYALWGDLLHPLLIRVCPTLCAWGLAAGLRPISARL